MAPRVLVCPIEMIEKPARWHEILTEAGFEIVCRPPDVSLRHPDKLLEYLPGVEGIVAGLETINRQVLEQSGLRAVARYGVGYDSVDVEAATERNIPVTITPGINQVSVAEHTLSMIFGLLRLTRERDLAVRDGSWRRYPNPRLSGRTLGLIGLGRIGKALATRAVALGVKVLAYDPYPDQEFAKDHNLTLCTLDEIWSESDIVSLHMPGSPGSKPLVNRETLARMRPGSLLINTARGVLVDEDALADAIQSGHLAGAGLDCFVVEPLPTTSRLNTFPNVLLSPHMAGQDHDSAAGAGSLACECLSRLFRGQEVPAGCLVNPQVWPGWKWKK